MTHIIRQGSLESPDVSVCIPTFSAVLERVRITIEAVLTHTPNCEVVVVDCQGEIRGYTTPQNEAMAAATASKYLIALNDDVIVSPGWYEHMRHVMHETGAACVTPDQTHTDGPQIFAPYCMMWKRKVWEELGGLDPQFEWWCSDIDLARRAVDAGYTPVRTVLPVNIEHQPGTSSYDADRSALNEMALHDLDRFMRKWGVTAEQEKVRLRDLVWHAD